MLYVSPRVLLSANLWILLVVASFFTGCTPNFSRGHLLEQRSAAPAPANAPRASITRFQLNRLNADLNDTAGFGAMRESFANAIYNSGSYSQVLAYPASGSERLSMRNFDIVLTPRFEQHFQPWWWYCGVFIAGGPLWPAMPRKGVIALQMQVTVHEGSNKVQSLSMTEEEPFDFFWYGPYRYFDLQDQTEHLYRKLLARLSVMLAEQESIGDVSGMVEGDVSGASMMERPAPRQPLSVALMEPECNGVDSLVGLTLNSKLRSELFALGNFQILERGRMQDILAEQGFQQSGTCTSTECYVKLGQLVGVDAIFVASYGRAGNLALLTLRAISVATGNVLEEVSTELAGGDELLLTEGVPALVKRLRVERIRVD